MTIEDALKELMGTMDWSCREDVSMWAGEAREFLRDHAPALLSALADQRRYRWLRDKSGDTTGGPSVYSGYSGFTETGLTYIDGFELDAEIDAELDQDGE